MKKYIKKSFYMILVVCMMLGTFTVDSVDAASAKTISSASELKNALSSKKGGSYKLSKDISGINSEIKIGKGKYTLDLNGHKITGINNSGSLIYVTGGSLTINDSKKKGKIINKGSQDTVGCKSGSLTINGGTYDGWYYAVYTEGGKTTINGGTFIGDEQGIRVGGSSKLVVNGGTIQAKRAYGKGISVTAKKKTAAVTINGGSIKALKGDGIYTATDFKGNIKVTGGNITGKINGIYMSNGALTINGGTVTATNGDAVQISSYYGNAINVNITGGTMQGKGSSGVGLYIQNRANVKINGGKFSGKWFDLFVDDSYDGDIEYDEALFAKKDDNSRQGMGVKETSFKYVKVDYKEGMEITDPDSLYSLCMDMSNNLIGSVSFTTTEYLGRVLAFYQRKWLVDLENINLNRDIDENGVCKVDINVTYNLRHQVSVLLENPDAASRASAKANGYAKQMRDIANKIIKNGMTDKQKIKAVHDYMVKTYSYDNSFKKESYDFYGMLDNKKGVCQGYALLFAMFMDMLDIRVQTVSGVASSAPGKNDYETHMWNKVMVDGKWYYIDVLFDDNSGSKKFYMLTKKKFYAIGVHKEY